MSPINSAQTAIVLALSLVLLVTCFSGRSKTVTAIAINPTRPDTLYITTNDRVYKSRNGGETWTVIVEGMGAARILSLAIHPVLSSTIYAGTMGDAVYRSMDGGQRWSIINAGMKEHVSVVNSFVFHPENPDIFFAGLTVGVFKTTNGGLMWEDMPTKGMASVYVVPIILDYTDPNIMYVGTSGGVYRSRNGGQTWDPLHKGMIKEEIAPGLALGVNTLAQDPLSPDNLYAGTTQGAYKSINRGESWTKITEGLSKLFIAHIVLDPENPHILYAGTSEGMFQSTDRGESWTPINQGLTSLNVRYVAMHPKNHQILYAGTQHGLFKTVDGGANWRELDILSRKEKSS